MYLLYVLSSLEWKQDNHFDYLLICLILLTTAVKATNPNKNISITIKNLKLIIAMLLLLESN